MIKISNFQTNPIDKHIKVSFVSQGIKTLDSSKMQTSSELFECNLANYTTKQLNCEVIIYSQSLCFGEYLEQGNLKLYGIQSKGVLNISKNIENHLKKNGKPDFLVF